MFFFVVIVLSNTFFFAFWIFEFFFEMRSKMILKFGKIYTAVILCGNHEKFKKAKLQTLIDEDNEILRERFMRTIKEVYRLKMAGELVLNPNTLERFHQYMRPENILIAIGNKPKELLRKAQKISGYKKKQSKVMDKNKRSVRKKNQSFMVKQITNLSSQLSEESKLKRANKMSTINYSDTDDSEYETKQGLSDVESVDLNKPRLDHLDEEEWKKLHQVKRAHLSRVTKNWSKLDVGSSSFKENMKMFIKN